MIQKLIAAIFALCFLVTPVLAEEQASNIDFRIDSVADNKGPEDRKIIAKDLKKGVFITVTGGWNTVYPKSTELAKKLLKERLSAKGVQVVDKPEDADIGLEFISFGIDMNEVETAEDAGVDIGVIAVGVIQIAANIIDYSTLLRGAKSPRQGGKFKKVFLARILDNPKISWRGKLDGDNLLAFSSDVIYTTNISCAEVTTMVFLAYIDKFIANNFVLEPKAEELPKSADATPTLAT